MQEGGGACAQLGWRRIRVIPGPVQCEFRMSWWLTVVVYTMIKYYWFYLKKIEPVWVIIIWAHVVFWSVKRYEKFSLYMINSCVGFGEQGPWTRTGYRDNDCGFCRWEKYGVCRICNLRCREMTRRPAFLDRQQENWGFPHGVAAVSSRWPGPLQIWKESPKSAQIIFRRRFSTGVSIEHFEQNALWSVHPY